VRVAYTESLADTWETADELKKEIERLQKQAEATSGEVQKMLHKRMHQLLRQKDKE